MAIELDGVIRTEEIEFYQRLTQLNKEFEIKLADSNLQYAAGILEMEQSNRMWRELNEAGRFFSQRYRWRIWWFDRTLLRGLSSGNRFIVWAIIVFFVIVAGVRVCVAAHR